MKLAILRIIPAYTKDGSFLEHRELLGIRIEPSWRRVNGTSAKLSEQTHHIRLNWPFLCKFRLNIAKYDVGDYLEEHVDTAGYGKLYSVQFALQKPKKGGELRCERFIVNRPRFKIFEPGRYAHEVTKVEEGRRLVLNLWVFFARRQRPAP